MILISIKQLIKDTLERRKQHLLKELLNNPAVSQSDLWKNENILAQCREIDNDIAMLCKAFDEKDKELQMKD